MEMDIQNIKRKKNVRTVGIYIKITKEMSQWLKEKEYSPTGIFYEAMKQLGFK